MAVIGSVFQGIRYDILQNGIHLFFIKPYFHFLEIAFVSKVYILCDRIRKETIAQVLHISIQFKLGYV